MNKIWKKLLEIFSFSLIVQKKETIFIVFSGLRVEMSIFQRIVMINVQKHGKLNECAKLIN